MAKPLRFSPTGIFETLAKHEVRYVLIGGLAATLHGSPLITNDVDICPDADLENLGRLAAALQELDARVWSPAEPEGVEFACDAKALAGAAVWNLVTRHGRVDITFEPSGTHGYPDLARNKVTYAAGGVDVPVADLRDVIRSKEAAGRERDRLALPTLRRLLERRAELSADEV